jgi:hypothetical protein
MMRLVVTFCNFVNMPKNDDKQSKYYGECSHQQQIFIVCHSDRFLQKVEGASWVEGEDMRLLWHHKRCIRACKATDHLFAPPSVSFSMLVTWSSWQISVSSTNMRTIPYSLISQTCHPFLLKNVCVCVCVFFILRHVQYFDYLLFHKAFKYFKGTENTKKNISAIFY